MTSQLDRSSQADKQGPNPQANSPSEDLQQNIASQESGQSSLKPGSSRPLIQGRGRPDGPEKSSNSPLQRLRRGWDNLGFRSKLAILLMAGAAIPIVVVTQALETVAEDRLTSEYEVTLKQELTFLDDAVESAQDINKIAAATIAKSARDSGINLNNPKEVAARRDALATIAEDPSNDLIGQSFHIITDAQGRTVSQYIETLKDQDFSSYPALPPENAPLHEPEYRPLSLPIGIPLGDIPIVKSALSTGQPLAGLELLNAKSLQRLGLDKQANIGIRKQKIEGLPEPKQPFPEGTYNVDQGKAGLVLMAVNPIEVKGKRVGTAMVGTLLNRNYLLVDKVKRDAGVSTATIFAQDWRVSTNVPYTDEQTRAIGTRASREVAEKTLNREETFLGEANIVGNDYITGYSPLYDHQKQLNPQAKPVGIAYVGEPKSQLQQILTNLRLTGYGIGGGMLLLAGLVALPIASTFSRPIRRLSGFAQQVAAGERGVRLEVAERQDEVGVLSQEMNKMAASIEANLEAVRQQAERTQQLSEITLHIRESLELEAILDGATQDIRAALKADRVVVYRLNEKWEGNIVTESVGSGWPVAKGVRIDDPCIKERQAEAYRKGRIRAISNIYQEPDLTDCYIQQLEQFEVKANLVAPLLVSGELFGLLIAHQCSGPRNWQQSEIDLFTQSAAQVGIALEQAKLLEQVEQARQQTEVIAQEQQQQKETLQRRMIELLMEVDPVAQGDLTVRAQVTPDEVGTIADSYNSIIGSLRQTVQRVQTTAQAVSQTAQGNETTVQTLSQEASRQAETITATLDQIQIMTDSVQQVALNAQQADLQAQQANETVQAGDEAMNRTVAGISAIRETVAETAKKVKRLGEASQKISRVVSLIGTFASRTNLLSLNAAIEAARAGEEGRGFAVVAEEVRSLAQQSATATAEIEQLVEDIQTETNDVVAAMEEGTEQVVTGTQLVEETRQKLSQVAIASAQISTLVERIAQSAAAQAQTSASVSQTIQEVAAIADQTSEQSVGMADSFTQLLAVAQELQVGVAQFKVN